MAFKKWHIAIIVLSSIVFVVSLFLIGFSVKTIDVMDN